MIVRGHEQVVTIVAVRRGDELARVLVRAATTSVEHVQDARLPPPQDPMDPRARDASERCGAETHGDRRVVRVGHDGLSPFERGCGGLRHDCANVEYARGIGR